MTTLHITRGLPGSGKTTFARQWTAAGDNRVRVNRDDVRAMLHEIHRGGATERETTAVCHAAVRAELRRGVDVICDDTNLNARNLRTLLGIAEQTGALVEIHDFPIDLNAAIRRDAERGKTVGAEIILAMAQRYHIKQDGTLPPLPAAEAIVKEAPTSKPYHGTPGAPKAIIVDLDGTIALNDGHRSPYDYTLVLNDTPNRPIVRLVQELESIGYAVIFMSGRDDSCMNDTLFWLEGHDLYAHDAPIFMRATGDKRDDAIVKLELFDQHVRDHYDVRYVLDDRNRVVAAWRSIGLTVLQVADGAF